jgi:hypothetical protein
MPQGTDYVARPQLFTIHWKLTMKLLWMNLKRSYQGSTLVTFPLNLPTHYLGNYLPIY